MGLVIAGWIVMTLVIIGWNYYIIEKLKRSPKHGLHFVYRWETFVDMVQETYVW